MCVYIYREKLRKVLSEVKWSEVKWSEVKWSEVKGICSKENFEYFQDKGLESGKW